MEQAELRAPPNWQDRSCVETPLELWFGPSDDAELGETAGERARREQQAKRLCASCPVINLCLTEELRRGVTAQWGVRGGLNARERKTLIRKRRATERRVA